MDIGSGKLGDPAGAILTTDADAVPAENWIEANLRSIGAGADLVGGRIVGDRYEEEALGPGFLRRARMYATYADLCDELAAIIDPLDHDPWPRHRDHTGASLAVRNDVYRSVGGMDPLPFREDIGFVRKVQRSGFLLCHPKDVTVTVSARTIGRAQGGMADCLRNWIDQEEAGEPVLLECPRSVERRLILRRRLRSLEGSSPERVLKKLDDLGLRAEELGSQPTVANLLAQFAADDHDVRGTVPASLAIAQLEQMIAMRRDVMNAA